MDDLEISKIVGVGCVALLAYVGLGQVAHGLVHVGALDEAAYVIEVEEDDDGGHGGEEAAAVPMSELLASADAEAGAKVFKKKCGSCHNADPGGKNATGPNLHGIMGRGIGGHGDFKYSGALAGIGGNWDWDSMNAFLTKPKDFAPGTKMSFAGLRKEADRANLMQWLNQQSDSPLDAPTE